MQELPIKRDLSEAHRLGEIHIAGVLFGLPDTSGGNRSRRLRQYKNLSDYVE